MYKVFSLSLVKAEQIMVVITKIRSGTNDQPRDNKI